MALTVALLSEKVGSVGCLELDVCGTVVARSVDVGRWCVS